MPKSSNNNTVDVLEERGPDKHAETKTVRDKKGRWIKGAPSPNPAGRPKDTIVDRFRDNPHAQTVINKLFEVANTLGTDTPNKDAIQAVKLIVERLVPSLKATENIVSDGTDQPFILMPEPKEPRKEDE